MIFKRVDHRIQAQQESHRPQFGSKLSSGLSPKPSQNLPFARIAQRAAIALSTFPFLTLPLGTAAIAAPCTYQCGSNQIRFQPGQALNIEFVNNTNGLINLERVLDIDLYWLRPDSDFTLHTNVGADDDMSLVFWDEHNRSVHAVLHRPSEDTLRVEFLPSGYDSDRAVHVSNDGRVLVY